MSAAVHLVAYDVSLPARLQAVGRRVKGFRSAGQKSVAECWLNAGRRERLLNQLYQLLDHDLDRLAVIRLDPRSPPMLFGVAKHLAIPVFLIV
ncbi:MAG: CRISPR-associated endonuclease Cas2 [Sphingomonadales bacterium]|nr:MAG: CRISPR-associated endonuclease Cas2 [Sphingomonadales bacterium]